MPVDITPPEINMPSVAPSRALPRFMLRLPDDIKAWIAAQAKQNSSSQNSEIVRSVRERMERTEREAVAHGR